MMFFFVTMNSYFRIRGLCTIICPYVILKRLCRVKQVDFKDFIVINSIFFQMAVYLFV